EHGSELFFKVQDNNQLVWVTVLGKSVIAIDTTGAGDAFTAALLHEIIKYQTLADFLSCREQVHKVALFANTTAALCVTKRGAIPAMPTLSEVLEQM
ncbi:MAG: PfkB family carbohydrate kinase, partial [bacterium]|nr:PfkB family carbohydrate kinase [bacterium]